MQFNSEISSASRTPPWVCISFFVVPRLHLISLSNNVFESRKRATCFNIATYMIYSDIAAKTLFAGIYLLWGFGRAARGCKISPCGCSLDLALFSIAEKYHRFYFSLRLKNSPGRRVVGCLLNSGSSRRGGGNHPDAPGVLRLWIRIHLFSVQVLYHLRLFFLAGFAGPRRFHIKDARSHLKITTRLDF